MRKSLRQGARFGVIALALLVSAATMSDAKMAGLDVNGNSACQQADFDMGQYWGSGTSGTVVTFDVFYHDIPNIFSFGCVFCTTEKSRVTSDSWVYNTPSGWTDAAIEAIDSESGAPSIDPSTSITETYPNYRCWLVQATDFSFATPMTAPMVLGTFTYSTAAEETWIPWILDGPNCGYLTVGFVSGTFSGAGEVCDHAYRTESSSWGSVKKMFR